jgi:hypothetical protein
MGAKPSGTSVKFRTRLIKGGEGTATGIVVPDTVVEKLGGGWRAPVNVIVNGYHFRSTIAVMGGRALLGISAERRAAAKVAAGCMLDVTLSLDTAERTVEIPPALAKALAKDKQAKAAFDALAFTYRKEHARAVAEAKAEETRDRRIAKIMAGLKK